MRWLYTNKNLRELQIAWTRKYKVLLMYNNQNITCIEQRKNIKCFKGKGQVT